MTILSRLPAPAGAKATAGITVAVLAAAGSTAVVFAHHQPSAPSSHVFVVGSTSPSTSDTTDESSTTSSSSTDSSDSKHESSKSDALVDTSSGTSTATGSSTSTSTNHGDVVTAAVAACKAERATGGPQPPSGDSTQGIGQCVSKVASGGGNGGSGPSGKHPGKP